MSSAGHGHKERCAYCDRRVYPAGSPEALADDRCKATRDHSIPLSLTSSEGLPVARIVTACLFCNNLKGDAPPSVFAWFINHCASSKDAEVKAEWKRFRYLLLEAGFRAAKALARFPRRPNAPAPAPTPAPPGRDVRGRYTKSDMVRDRRTA